MAHNYGLGRGLASLIPRKRKTDGEADESASSTDKKITEPQKDFNYFSNSSNASGKPMPEKKEVNAQEIALADVVQNPYQPRLNIDEIKLKELAESIKEHGIIQPIVVNKKGRLYEIIAGERRYQAAKLAGLLKIPAVIRETNNQQKLELAVVENIQRQDLNPIEEAKSYLKLTEEFDLSQEEVAKKIGKSRSAVANKLRLLALPIEIQKGLIENLITEGHAKAILALENPEKQRALYDLILKNSLTVRQVENKTREVSVRTHKRIISVDPEIKQLEDSVSQTLGTKVKIKKSGSGGTIIIDYYSQEELDNILSRIK